MPLISLSNLEEEDNNSNGNPTLGTSKGPMAIAMIHRCILELLRIRDDEAPFDYSREEFVKFLNCPDIQKRLRYDDEFGDTVLHRITRTSFAQQGFSYLYPLYPNAIKIQSKEGSLPLHCALSSHPNNTTLITTMLAKYPKAGSVADNFGRLPLHVAVQNCAHPKILKLLVESNRRALTLQDDNGMLPLHLACRSTGPFSIERIQKMAKYLIKMYPEAISVTDNNDRLPLHIALDVQSPIDVIIMLMDRMDDDLFEKVDNENRTIVHIALDVCDNEEWVERLNRNRIQMLLEAYPEALAISDRYDRRPVDIALERNLPHGIIELVEDEG